MGVVNDAVVHREHTPRGTLIVWDGAPRPWCLVDQILPVGNDMCASRASALTHGAGHFTEKVNLR